MGRWGGAVGKEFLFAVGGKVSERGRGDDNKKGLGL